MTREEARRIIATWLVSSGYIEGWFDEEDVEALRMAIEALLILGEDGIVNCCGCIYWNKEGFCKITDKHKEDFDYCSDGRRE